MPQPMDEVDTGAGLRAGRRRRWSVVAICWCLAGAATVAAIELQDRLVAPHVLIGPVDHEGLAFITLTTAILSCAAAVCSTTRAASSPPAAGRVRVLTGALDLAVTSLLLMLLYPMLMYGALAFSTEYRTIGAVDGHELVAEVQVGLGQFPISAGVRHGLSVDFSRTTGDTYITRGPTLDGTEFHIDDGPGFFTVTYRPGPRHHQHVGVLIVPKTP